MQDVIHNNSKNTMMTQTYSILIQWSDEDKLYIASLPEFGPYVRTHGNTYSQALQSAEELLKTMLEHYQAQGKELPQPAIAS